MPTSTSPKAWKTFDYSALDDSTCQFVQQQTGEIKALMKRTAQDIVEIGQKLVKVKEKLGHGRFGAWLEAEFEWSIQTAKRFMNVAVAFQNQQFVDFIAPSALYELAAPSIPSIARDEAIARAKAGESITYKAAKNIKQKYASPALKPETAPKQERQVVQQSSSTNVLVAAPQPRIKQEIIAIRPPVEVPSGASQSTTMPMAGALVLPQRKLSPTDDEPGVWWQLGGKHFLFNGDPNSLRFLARIPGNLNLLLAFPTKRDWNSLIQANTCFIRTDLSQEKDARLFEDTVESILLLCSNVGEVVVNCFIPSIDILTIANRLDRRVLLAEPDTKRVNAIVTDWKQAGLKVEKVKRGEN